MDGHDHLRRMETDDNTLVWPASDYSRTPYWVYVDEGIYEREQERLYRGPTWSYLGLEAEVPEPGCYVVSSIGDTPVVVNRTRAGGLAGFVNRCAHRGAVLCRDLAGRVAEHICVYHQWRFDLEGKLTGVPYRRGIKGQGGMDPAFDMAAHGLERVRVESYRGVIFGTFSASVEPVAEYIGPEVGAYVDRVFHKPVKVLGYARQRVPANWKLYCENTKDPYHAGLLHLFHATFGTYRSTQKGGVALDRLGRHSSIYAIAGTDDQATLQDAYKETAFQAVGENASPFTLEDPSLLKGRKEFEDGISNLIVLIFPSVVIQQIANTLATRKVIPHGPQEFELYWTYFGYADDDAELEGYRVKQANMIGPGGFISMEDGEATRLVQEGARRYETARASILAMGGLGPIETPEHLVTEVPIRGMWREYCRLMGFKAPREQGA